MKHFDKVKCPSCKKIDGIVAKKIDIRNVPEKTAWFCTLCKLLFIWQS